jgi:hypothetical protein
VFRYALSAHQIKTDSLDRSRIARVVILGTPGSDFIVSIGRRDAGCHLPDLLCETTGNRFQQAGTFMHELGHTLGLRHGGNEDTPEYKPNYLSVMNYMWQFAALSRTDRNQVVDLLFPLFDYSRFSTAGTEEGKADAHGTIGALNERTLVEAAGLIATGEAVKFRFSYHCPGGGQVKGLFRYEQSPCESSSGSRRSCAGTRGGRR